jgi:hypothetical protein
MEKNEEGGGEFGHLPTPTALTRLSFFGIYFICFRGSLLIDFFGFLV